MNFEPEPWQPFDAIEHDFQDLELPSGSQAPHSAASELRSLEQTLENLAHCVRTNSVEKTQQRDQLLGRFQQSFLVGRFHVRMWQAGLAALVLIVAFSFLLGRLTADRQPTALTSQQAEQEAVRLSRQTGISLDWALVDVFQRSNKQKSLKVSPWMPPQR
jgi:hypothetical protein